MLHSAGWNVGLAAVRMREGVARGPGRVASMGQEGDVALRKSLGQWVLEKGLWELPGLGQGAVVL